MTEARSELFIIIIVIILIASNIMSIHAGELAMFQIR